MSLGRLGISHIRNITGTSLELAPAVNLFLGPNGSGKTSLLESVYFLGSGRTFRSASVDPLISRDEAMCTVFGVVVDREGNRKTLGVNRERAGGREIKINGEHVKRASQLARDLPTLVLGPDTVELVIGPPGNRRRFLNWGVFHVEPGFAVLWEQANRCLRQRNELLRRPGVTARELASWDVQLGELGTQIDLMRAEWMASFEQHFSEICGQLSRLMDINCSYQRGWDVKATLPELLDRQRDSDMERGYTQSGFQRADLMMRVGKAHANAVCSRGELKVLAWAMVLSQGKVFADRVGANLVYLVDDLASELDESHRAKVCEVLSGMPGQILATGIDERQLKGLWPVQPKVFHVEHGSFSAEESVDERR